MENKKQLLKQSTIQQNRESLYNKDTINKSKKTIDQKLDDQDADLDDIIKTLDDTIEVGQKIDKELDKNKQKIAEARGTTKEVTGNMDVAGRNLSEMKKRSGFMGFIRSLTGMN